MINSIVSNSQYLHVNGGNPSRPCIEQGYNVVLVLNGEIINAATLD